VFFTSQTAAKDISTRQQMHTHGNKSLYKRFLRLKVSSSPKLKGARTTEKFKKKFQQTEIRDTPFLMMPWVETKLVQED
jgi:hypothetical protein